MYITVDNDEAESFVKEQKKKVKEELKKLESEKQELTKQMAELKMVLYAKFGKSINLESAEQTIND